MMQTAKSPQKSQEEISSKNQKRDGDERRPAET